MNNIEHRSSFIVMKIFDFIQARVAKSTALTKIMMVAVGRWQMLEQLEASLEQLNARQQLTNLVHAVLQVGDSICVSTF